MKVSWVQPDIRDEVIDYVRYYSNKTEIVAADFIRRIGIGRSKYYDWKKRYGKVNEHNSWIPRDCYEAIPQVQNNFFCFSYISTGIPSTQRFSARSVIRAQWHMLIFRYKSQCSHNLRTCSQHKTRT